MSNVRITDLPIGTSIADINAFEQVNAALNRSEQVPGSLLRSTFAPVGEITLQDDFATEFFDGYTVGAISSFTGGQGWINNGVGTNASIIASTMADGRAQQRMALNNGSYGRKMPWAGLWNRIKVVLAVRINNGANFLNTEGYIGVCSGTTNMANSATCANFVGMRWGDGTGTSTFTAGTKISVFDVPTFRAVTRRVNTTTDRGSLSSGHTISSDGGYLSFVCLEMSRLVFANDAASVNYSVAECSSNLTTAQFSHTKHIASVACYGDVTSNLASSGSDTAIIGSSGVTAAPFAFDQSTGALDTINLYWPQAFNLEIAAIAVRKVH